MSGKGSLSSTSGLRRFNSCPPVNLCSFQFAMRVVSSQPQITCSWSSNSKEHRFFMGSYSACHGSKFAVTVAVAWTYVGLVPGSFPGVCGIQHAIHVYILCAVHIDKYFQFLSVCCIIKKSVAYTHSVCSTYNAIGKF